MKYGLIGRSLSHSRSKEIHALLGNDAYELVELEPDELEGFFRRADFCGINVTIPYKEAAMRFCEPDEAARKIGCVNVVINDKGKLRGSNTDYYGFSYMAREAGIFFAGKKVAVLGSGGASKTAASVARDEGARDVAIISREGRERHGDLSSYRDAEILVNATPVGMFPKDSGQPVSLDDFPCLGAVMDVIYNPLNTSLIQSAVERGLKTATGLSMLVAQAARAHELFFDIARKAGARDDDGTTRALSQARRLFTGIALIGMPGCGKTTAGMELAKILGKNFIDTDLLAEELTGKKPGEIIAEKGEPFFREIERKAVALAAAKQGAVIATGGGAALFKENMDALRRNCAIYFLDCADSDLARHGRPLSANLSALRAQRQGLYESACHRKHWRAGGGIEETARALAELFDGDFPA
ncbi:MAG: hypothetical protein FWE09_02655 [Treponema sp.]|nr:hypothetical protein [Treponema sp.]